MVNAKGISILSNRYAEATDLRREEPRGHTRHYGQRGEAVIIRHADAQSPAGDLRVMPLDGEENRRVTQVAEVISVLRVLPGVLTIDHEVFAEGLLQASVVFVADSGVEISRNTRHQRRDDRIKTSRAGKHKVLVERSLQRAGIRRTENRVGLADVV